MQNLRTHASTIGVNWSTPNVAITLLLTVFFLVFLFLYVVLAKPIPAGAETVSATHGITLPAAAHVSFLS